MRFTWILVLSLVFSGVATPGLAKLIDELGQPTKVIDESGLKISIFPEVAPHASGLPAGVSKLFLTGAGVRQRRVALFNVNVYVVASYVDHTFQLPTESPMSGISQSKVNALQLTFLRDISGDLIRKAFIQSLSRNGADPKSPGLSKILDQLDMPMPKGSHLILLGFASKAGSETLFFETPNGKTLTTEGPGVATQFWKIWFGEPADSGLEKLRTELVGGRS